MHAERWRQVEELYKAALDSTPAQRSAFLAEHCKGDQDLRNEVESLLRQEFSTPTSVDGFSHRGLADAPYRPASSQLVEGAQLGPYRIEALLGAGGMGEVYRARDSRLERAAAVKVLLPALAGQPDFRKRFLREARAVAALNHRGIATIYEAGESLDRLYLAMEYVAGSTLKQELALGSVSTGRLIDYSRQIAEVLDHAHARGIIHRDIKPGNIMITPEGLVKVLDFGLAKEISPLDETSTNLTTPGIIVGTMHYCPPEVLTGRPATARSDLYSLGVLMYELACGRLPFDGFQGLALISAVIAGEAVPLRQRNPALPEALVRVIARAMSPRLESRFASATELACALRDVEGASAVNLRPQPAMPVVGVLDFENLSGDDSVDWLGTGLAETITADLKRLKVVQVVSRERVQQELRRLGGSADLTALGVQMNARWLVNGSYQRSGNRIRITPRLLEPASGEFAATIKIDGAWDDIFDLQDRVVSVLVDALQLETKSSGPQRIAAPETLRVEAYEQYSQGRKSFSTLGKDSLEQARLHFERAIELDPAYAMAYFALGQTYAMRWIHRTDPDDLSRASGFLQRALELDPEFGEPYALLSYVYLRQSKLSQAIQAGTKGVENNPDLYTSHYFLGVACWVAAYELSDTFLQRAVKHFLDAIRVEPAYAPTWVNLGTLVLHTGVYDRAESLLREALDLELSERAISAFPFEEMLLAQISMRRLDWKNSLDWHQHGLRRLSTTDHMYRELIIAAHSCGAGEVWLRHGDSQQALADFHRAWAIAREYPRMLGNERILTRTLAGMASAYAALGDRPRASQLVKEAAQHLDSILSAPGTFVHGTSTFELCHVLAVACLRLNDTSGACGFLQTAVDKGWRDLPWLQSDPELAPIQSNCSVQSLIERMRRFPPLVLAHNA
jgi:serine/threonine-protein kinase